MRAIAAEAGVDPALVTHYFGSKQQLFVSIVKLPIDPALVIGLAAGGADGAGERLARAVIGVLESPAVAVEPLASADPGRVAQAIAPVLQHYLTGDLEAS